MGEYCIAQLELGRCVNNIQANCFIATMYNKEVQTEGRKFSKLIRTKIVD